ncbi:unnamed protein product, partial [marine sediment metagenome]
DAGGRGPVYVDRPYLKDLKYVRDVDRDIIWEDHRYVTSSRNVEGWSLKVNESVQRFVTDFGKPLYMGEYGIAPWSAYDNYNPVSVIGIQTQFLDSLPLYGRNFHSLGIFTGEQVDVMQGPYITPEQSSIIFNIIAGGAAPTPPPPVPPPPVPVPPPEIKVDLSSISKLFVAGGILYIVQKAAEE